MHTLYDYPTTTTTTTTTTDANLLPLFSDLPSAAFWISEHQLVWMDVSKTLHSTVRWRVHSTSKVARCQAHSDYQ